MMMRRRMQPQQRTSEQLARLYATQGRCPKCEIVLTWDSRDVPGHITKGQLACPDCGSVLLRTNSHSLLARVSKNPKPVAAPHYKSESVPVGVEACKAGACLCDTRCPGSPLPGEPYEDEHDEPRRYGFSGGEDFARGT